MYNRKISPLERLFSHSPFSIVTVVARIKGKVTESMLRNAVSKVKQRHQNLRVRIIEDSSHEPRFTEEGVEEIPVMVVPRDSDNSWIGVIQEISQVPFEFEVRPAIKFILVRSPANSELIIFCHHILCDGLSLAYLARDLMIHLGNVTREAEVLPASPPIGLKNVPADVSQSGLVKALINRINGKWEKDKVFFDQEDYENLTEAYWNRYTHQVCSIELSEAHTAALVDRCRKENVTVNSALTASIIGAQNVVQGAQPFHSSIGIAGNVRDRLKVPVGEGMGFYAGVVNLKYKYDGRKSFWDNARSLHKKAKPLFTSKNLFKDFMNWFYLDPSILEAITFKKLGGLVSQQKASYEKISSFNKKEDAVLSLLKRDKMETLDRIIMGTAVANLTRMNFPRRYGGLELDRLIMKPGGAFPLVNVNLILGAVTASDKLSLLVEYTEDNIDREAMDNISEKVLGFLLDD